jgi:sortase A
MIGTLPAMTFARVLGRIGRTFIATGVFLLLFAGFQLWGTGVLEARAQGDLENDFEDFLSDAGVDGPGDAATPAPAVTDDPSTEEVETPAPTPTPRVWTADQIYRDDGQAIGHIRIPAIGVDKYFVQGVSTEALREGPGHYKSTPLPGMPGNASIAGHRTTYGAPFNRIDELQPGDVINVRTVQGKFEYRVIAQENGSGHFIVPPSGVEVLRQDFEDHPNRLTLTACHPKYSAAQRIIVVAELVGEPAPFVAPPWAADEGGGELASEFGGDDATPTPSPTAPDTDPEPSSTVSAEPTAAPTVAEPTPGGDELAAPADPDGLSTPDGFGSGLDGERDAIVPAVLWGLAALMLWALVHQLGRRWRMIPVYVLGLAPFTVMLFICFMFVDKALPSY